MTGAAPPDDWLREAIHSCTKKLDCFVALLLAMTKTFQFLIVAAGTSNA
jgi:hypothetical protein